MRKTVNMSKRTIYLSVQTVGRSGSRNTCRKRINQAISKISGSTSAKTVATVLLKKLCTKAKGNRQVHWNPIYEEMKAKARKVLEDETLKKVYSLPKIEIDTVFGNLKGNLAFRRFLLRGLDKVTWNSASWQWPITS